MKKRLLTVLPFAVLALGLVLTVAHIVYAAYAYEHCSIIYFVGKELW